MQSWSFTLRTQLSRSLHSRSDGLVIAVTNMPFALEKGVIGSSFGWPTKRLPIPGTIKSFESPGLIRRREKSEDSHAVKLLHLLPSKGMIEVIQHEAVRIGLNLM